MPESLTTILFGFSGAFLVPLMLVAPESELREYTSSTFGFGENKYVTNQGNNKKENDKLLDQKDNSSYATSSTRNERVEMQASTEGVTSSKKKNTTSFKEQTSNTTPTTATSSVGSKKNISTKKVNPNKKQQKVIDYKVPFTPQAPTANWNDVRQDYGCEEASLLMAMKWVKGADFSSPRQAEQEILKMTDFEQKKYGEHRDLSASTTAKVIEDYFKYGNFELEYNISIEDIINKLRNDRVVVLPVNGRVLGNPNYIPPGPKEHMIVIKGFNQKKKEFITHDPGTRNGRNFRYSFEVMENSLRDYNTGFHEPVSEDRTAMISIKNVIEK